MVGGRRAGCLDGAGNSASGVWLSLHAGGELSGPITGEDQMCVGINEARKHGSALHVHARDCPVHVATAAHPRDEPVVDDDSRVRAHAEKPIAERWVIGDQFADVRHGKWLVSVDHVVDDSIMGMRTCLSRATTSASSYPASTWRMTPMPGSLVSTRASFCAASAVPSATDTWPA